MGTQPYARTYSFVSPVRHCVPLLLLGPFLLAGCLSKNSTLSNGEKVALSMTGVHHMGTNFTVSDYYINSAAGGNIGRGGGGGSKTCCTFLPKKWTPGLMVDLRWAVADRSKENKEETGRHVYTSIKHTIFHATVPVERYETPDGVFPHFYPNGGARVVATLNQSEFLQNASTPTDPEHVVPQTKGATAPALFSEAELSRMAQEDIARTRSSAGDE